MPLLAVVWRHTCHRRRPCSLPLSADPPADQYPTPHNSNHRPYDNRPRNTKTIAHLHHARKKNQQKPPWFTLLPCGRSTNNLAGRARSPSPWTSSPWLCHFRWESRCSRSGVGFHGPNTTHHGCTGFTEQMLRETDDGVTQCCRGGLGEVAPQCTRTLAHQTRRPSLGNELGLWVGGVVSVV